MARKSKDYKWLIVWHSPLERRVYATRKDISFLGNGGIRFDGVTLIGSIIVETFTREKYNFYMGEEGFQTEAEVIYSKTHL